MNRIKKMVLLLALLLHAFASCTQCAITVLFSPYDHPTTRLIEYINSSKKSIYAAVYFLTDKTIVQALINAKKRNVIVEIILDPISTARFGQAAFLAQNNIPVFVYDNKLKPEASSSNNRWFGDGPIMHNKFAIFDATTCWTGSFNWTGAANTKNMENVLICNEKSVCKDYEAMFTKIKNAHCKPYAAPAKSKKKTEPLRKKLARMIKYTWNETLLIEQIKKLFSTQEMPQIVP